MGLSVIQMLRTIAPHVDGGGVVLCNPESREAALAAYNRAVEELMMEDSWQGTRATIQVAAQNGIFWTPPCVMGVRAVNIDNRPAPIRPGTWQFVANGPGSFDVRGPEIRDLGDGYPTSADLPAPMHLVAYSDAPEDGDAWINFDDRTGLIWSGRQLGFQTRRGEKLNIACGIGEAAQPVSVTANAWTVGPSGITKSKTRGNVFVFGRTLESETLFWLATLAPSQETVSYRRYQLIHGTHAGGTCNLLCDCDLRFIPAVDDDEEALIQNGPAVDLMVEAINYRDADNNGSYMAKKNMAVSKLNKQLERLSAGQTFRPVIRPERAGSAIRQIPRGRGFYNGRPWG